MSREARRIIQAGVFLLAVLPLGPVAQGQVTAKSVVFDVADSFAPTSRVAVRAIEFRSDGTTITVVQGSFATYGGQYNATYARENAFITALSKTGPPANASWIGSNKTNERLVVVFNTPITFDEIVVSPYHNSGGSTTAGMRNVKVTVSANAITDGTYNAVVSGGTVLSESQWPQHVGGNVVMEASVWTDAPAPLDPGGDEDGDGYTNGEETNGGSDPQDATIRPSHNGWTRAGDSRADAALVGATIDGGQQVYRELITFTQATIDHNVLYVRRTRPTDKTWAEADAEDSSTYTWRWETEQGGIFSDTDSGVGWPQSALQATPEEVGMGYVAADWIDDDGDSGGGDDPGDGGEDPGDGGGGTDASWGLVEVGSGGGGNSPLLLEYSQYFGASPQFETTLPDPSSVRVSEPVSMSVTVTEMPVFTFDDGNGRQAYSDGWEVLMYVEYNGASQLSGASITSNGNTWTLTGTYTPGVASGNNATWGTPVVVFRRSASDVAGYSGLNGNVDLKYANPAIRWNPDGDGSDIGGVSDEAWTAEEKNRFIQAAEATQQTAVDIKAELQALQSLLGNNDAELKNMFERRDRTAQAVDDSVPTLTDLGQSVGEVSGDAVLWGGSTNAQTFAIDIRQPDGSVQSMTVPIDARTWTGGAVFDGLDLLRQTFRGLLCSVVAIYFMSHTLKVLREY